MSADNYIAVQKRPLGWYVWMESASNDKPSPYNFYRFWRFTTFSKALDFAYNWLSNEAVVEYGIRILDVFPTPESGNPIAHDRPPLFRLFFSGLVVGGLAAFLWKRR